MKFRMVFVVSIIFAEWPKEGSVACPGALLAAGWNIVITWQHAGTRSPGCYIPTKHTHTWQLSLWSWCCGETLWSSVLSKTFCLTFSHLAFNLKSSHTSYTEELFLYGNYKCRVECHVKPVTYEQKQKDICWIKSTAWCAILFLSFCVFLREAVEADCLGVIR